MKSEIFNVEIKGTAPLLHHRYLGNAPKGEAKKVGELYDPGEDARAALYADNKGNPYIPATWIEGTLKKAAAGFKWKGRKTFKDLVTAGVRVEPLEIPLPYEWEVDIQGVRVKQARIERARPRFDAWSAKFDLVIMSPEIRQEILKEILTEAGEMYGIGDWRPKYGRFEIKRWKKKNANAPK